MRLRSRECRNDWGNDCGSVAALAPDEVDDAPAVGRAERAAENDVAPAPKQIQTSVKRMRPEARRLHEQFVQLVGSDAAEAAEAALLLRQVRVPCLCECVRARARVWGCVLIGCGRWLLRSLRRSWPRWLVGAQRLRRRARWSRRLKRWTTGLRC